MLCKLFLEHQGSGFDDCGSGFDDCGSGFDDCGSGFDDNGGRFDDCRNRFDDCGSGFDDLGSGFDNLGRESLHFNIACQVFVLGRKLEENDGLATAPDPREVSFFCHCRAAKSKRKKDTACGRGGT